MGPGRAAEVIREGLYRGADNGYLLTDRAFAGADTLATSYALATAIRKIGDYDIIIGGRQAIDGDTAQVGPQVAEKLGLTQVTYAEEILNVDKAAGKITVKRHIDGGVETVEGPLPIVITVNGSAAPCRPRNAKLVQNTNAPSVRRRKPPLKRRRRTAVCSPLREIPLSEHHGMECGRRQRRPRTMRSERLAHQGENHSEYFIPGQRKQNAHGQRPGCRRFDC